MKTTTYWKAKCLDDHDCYSLRARTKKEVMALIDAYGCTLSKNRDDEPCYVNGDYPRFSLPVKVTLHYTDQMDLIQQLRGEGASDY